MRDPQRSQGARKGWEGTILGRNVECVVWDWNGTLLDDVELCLSVMNELLREEGLQQIDRARYLEVFDIPVRPYYERLGFQLDDERWAALCDRFIAGYQERAKSCRLHDDATVVLERFATSGVENSVVSAARQDHVEEMLSHHGVRSQMRDVVGLADHHAGGKTVAGLDWMTRRAIEPSKTVFVGDTLHDLDVARAMGLRCILVSHGHQSRRRLESRGCEVVPSLASLLD